MTGGSFTKPKIRPGTYVNVKNGKAPSAANSPTGVVVIPLIDYDYGKRGEFIKLNANNLDIYPEIFGRSVYDDNVHMSYIRFAAMNAETLYVYICKGGTAASVTFTFVDEGTSVTATAKYAGTRGNKLKFSFVANAVSGYDVEVTMDGSVVEKFEGITALTDIDSKYIGFTYTGTVTLAALAAKSLTGGTDTAANNAVTDMLDACEKIKFNTLFFPSSDAGLQASCKSKIKYIRDTIGWKCQAVCVDYAADYEAIINQTNAAIFEGSDLTKAQTAAWRAGLAASASYTKSNTYAVFAGATGIVGGGLTNEQAEAAILAGKSFLSIYEDGKIVLEYDINSKVTFGTDDPVDIFKNRPLKVYDTLCNDILLTFTPNKFNNDSQGWDAMEGLGRGMLQTYQADGAIQNVDTDSDFVVDRDRSTGDSVYITVAVQPVDSAEKYYFTVIAK